MSPNYIVLYVIPKPLIGVQLRRIKWQEEMPKTFFYRFNLFKPLLKDPPEQSLRRQPQLPQKTINRSLAQFDIKTLKKGLPYHLGCAERKGEVQLQRILQGYGLINSSNAFAVQLWVTASSFARTPASPASVPIKSQPGIYCGTADMKRSGNRFRAFAHMNTAHSPILQSGQGPVIQSSCIHLLYGHTTTITVASMSIL